jgi:hypothetical protein
MIYIVTDFLYPSVLVSGTKTGWRRYNYWAGVNGD